MRKILVLGSDGMAGHTIVKYLKSLNKYTVKTTARRGSEYIEPDYYLDVLQPVLLEGLKKVVLAEDFDIIINCIGVLVKPSQDKPGVAMAVNMTFPHFLEAITTDTPTKVIHLSTDCVFSGNNSGWYYDTAIPDGEGVYSITKALGELDNTKDLTVRMSIIGNELKDSGSGLFDWFLRQSGEIKGYRQVMWNGVTTLELAKNLERLINTSITGIYQLAPNFSISKYALLKLIQETWMKTDVIINPDDSFNQNKTLKCSKSKEFTPGIPCYRKQLQELKYFMEKSNA